MKINLLIVFASLFMAFLSDQNFAQTLPPIDSGVSRELARWRTAHYSDVRYKLNLTLEKRSPVLKGQIEISLKNTGDQIILDWRKIKGKEQFTSIANVQLNNKAAKFEEINEHLVFKENVKAGENVIKLDFTSPIATSGAAITRYVDKEDGGEYVYSLFVPSDASTAFPCFDQPDLKAQFKLSVYAPPSWKVVSNGNAQYLDGVFANYINWEFEETKPISTYVFAFAAGDFVEFEDRVKAQNTTAETQSSRRVTESKTARKSDYNSTIKNSSPRFSPQSQRFSGENFSQSKIYVRKSQIEKLKPHIAEVFRLNREAVKYLESYFDFKFPFPKYDLVLIPEFPFGGMEHAGATFLRESAIIFPQEPTANDYISRGNLIFHEAAHQWFGDTVTMRWFDDLWLKEGFAEFMAYKTLEKVLPQYNAWKAFYERNKPLAYQTDSTKGTTPIYQEIPNLSAAKSAYGNIVYRKAPSFLRQAEFYLGADKFQIAVRSFLKQNAFKNAEWQDLVESFEAATNQDLKTWAEIWVKKRGSPIMHSMIDEKHIWYKPPITGHDSIFTINLKQKDALDENGIWPMRLNILFIHNDARGRQTWTREFKDAELSNIRIYGTGPSGRYKDGWPAVFVFPNYEDYGYGTFLLDKRSLYYVSNNIQNEKDDFLRAMMWGSLWDSVREAELDPKDYVKLVIKNIASEKDELTINTILNRVSTAMNYYVSDLKNKQFAPQMEAVLLERMKNAETLGQRITFYRAFLNLAATDAGKQTLKDILSGKLQIRGLQLKTKDKFDLVTKLLILNDADAPKLSADLEKSETSDEAKRYAYAARAGIATKENKQKYFDDFLGNKEISESYIEAAIAPFNSIKHAELTAPFLEKALQELPNLKRTRKIFFINNWLSAFISGQKDEKALSVVNSFLSNNPNLDRDLRLKVLENVDLLERAIKIRTNFSD